jgi:phospholipid/cholesterol/gamma-HCH transport system permease protein
MSQLQELTENLREFVRSVGAAVLFLLRVLGQFPRLAMRPRLIVEQIYNAGALSLVIIMTCGMFIGMVMGLQFYDILARFGSEEAIGVGAALGLLKELGPVVTALLFAGRAGTALASEIGLMKATDQLSAMEIMAVDPIMRVVAPRFLGGVIAMPLLVGIFIAVGLFGVQLVAVQQLGVEASAFWSQMRSSVGVDDVTDGIVKSCVFGVACSLIAVHEGYTAIPTAEGVGRATTRTVVISAVLILILDYMLTAVML